MRKWEYDITWHNIDEDSERIGREANEMGEEGWEAVCSLPGHGVSGGHRILYKRLKAEAPNA
jgi:hypothetical protein